MVGPDLVLGKAGQANSNGEAEFEGCEHPRSFPTRRTIKGGRVGPWSQCPDCGSARALKVADYPELASLPEFDEGLGTRIYDQRWQVIREKHEREKAEKDQEWWDNYNAYLASSKWQSKRLRVLERANWTCEACLERKAVQVHHTSYKHLGNEPLFELRAVCVICHDEITKMDRRAG